MRRSTAAPARRSPRCSACRPRSFPARSISSPARCTRSTAGVLVDESLLYARCGARPVAPGLLWRRRPAWRRSRSAGRRPHSPDERDRHALAYGKSPIVTKAPMVARPSHDVVFWAQGFGAWGRFNADGNAASVRRDLAGFISGVDTRVGAQRPRGHRGGLYRLEERARRTRHGQCRDRAIAGYGGWSFGALNLRAGGAYAFHSDRHRPHDRVPGLLRSRDRALRRRHRAGFRRSRLRLRVRQCRGRAVRGRRLGAGRHRRGGRARRAGGAQCRGARHSRSAIDARHPRRQHRPARRTTWC